MWMLHFLAHLKESGTAGFVMATGELSNSEIARQAVRKALVEHNIVDCIVQLTPQLFANTQIGCSLWFLSKNRAGGGGFRKRTGEFLFIDGRRLGSLIPGSRKQKQLSYEEVARIASVYRQFRREAAPKAVPGFCRTATLEEIREQNYVLTPGRYVGAEEGVNDDEPFDVRFPLLTGTLQAQLARSRELDAEIKASLADLLNG